MENRRVIVFRLLSKSFCVCFLFIAKCLLRTWTHFRLAQNAFAIALRLTVVCLTVSHYWNKSGRRSILYQSPHRQLAQWSLLTMFESRIKARRLQFANSHAVSTTRWPGHHSSLGTVVSRRGARWLSGLERWTGDRWSWVQIPLQHLRFGTLAIPFTPLRRRH